MKEIFTDIYEHNKWHGKEGPSGSGSTVAATKFLRPKLQRLLKSLNVKTLLDLPCGDFNWMRLMNLSNVSYMGADIVSELIHINKVKYESSSIGFMNFDAVNNVPHAYTMIMCRDMLPHLSNFDVAKVLENFQRSGSHWLLTTSFMHVQQNRDIVTGSWRPINLTLPPFNLVPRKVLIEQNAGAYQDKAMILVRL